MRAPCFLALLLAATPACAVAATHTVEFDATFTVHAIDVATTDLQFDTSRRWMAAERNLLRFDVPTTDAVFSPSSLPEEGRRAIQSRTRAAFDAALQAICAAAPTSPLLRLDDAALVRTSLCMLASPGTSTLVPRPYCLTAQLAGAPHADPSPVDAPSPPPDLDGDFCGGPGTPVTVALVAPTSSVLARASFEAVDDFSPPVAQWIVTNGGTTSVWLDPPTLLESGAPSVELALRSACPSSPSSPLAPGASCNVFGFLRRTDASAGPRTFTIVVRAHEIPAPPRRLVTDQVLHASAQISFDGGLAKVDVTCRPPVVPPEVTCADGSAPRDVRRTTLGFDPVPGTDTIGDWYVAGARAAGAEVLYRGSCARDDCAGPVGVRRFASSGLPAGGPVSIARPSLGTDRFHELWVLACGATTAVPASIDLTVLDGIGLQLRTTTSSLGAAACL